MYFLMQGTPFIYQGQEIGMTNVQFPSINDYNDVEAKNLYRNKRKEGMSDQEIMEIIWKTGRDNSRTPMQWNAEKNAGFTTGRPWLKVNPNYKEINVELALRDENSIYHYYKKLIEIRKKYQALIYGSYDLILENHNEIFAYTRKLEDEQVLVLTNLFANNATFNLPASLKSKKKKLLLSNYHHDLKPLELRPYEARVYLV